MIREKRTLSGPLLEADFYPIYSDGRKMPTRAPKSKPSAEEQRRYNRTMAIKKLIRLVNANFDESDYWLHPTYAPQYAPQDEKQARRDITNFFRRLRTKRASAARQLQKELDELTKTALGSESNGFLPVRIARLEKEIAKLSQPLKYIYVVECVNYKRGPFAGRKNYHFHVFITGGLDRSIIEEMWPYGMRVNCCRFQPERFGPEAAAVYMSKDPQGSKRFVCSRGLKHPNQKSRDGRISHRGVERLAKLRENDAEYWEKRYKGYRFLRCYSRFNAYNGQWYVSAVMYRADGAPPNWEVDDWITEDFS